MDEVDFIGCSRKPLRLTRRQKLVRLAECMNKELLIEALKAHLDEGCSFNYFGAIHGFTSEVMKVWAEINPEVGTLRHNYNLKKKDKYRFNYTG